MRENADEENYEYGHFLHSEKQFSFPHFLSFHIFIHIRIGYGDLHSKSPYTRLYCIVLYCILIWRKPIALQIVV